jgi:hypothetical protein
LASYSWSKQRYQYEDMTKMFCICNGFHKLETEIPGDAAIKQHKTSVKNLLGTDSLRWLKFSVPFQCLEINAAWPA